MQTEHSGGPVDYYQVAVNDPTTKDRAAYMTECNDIIEALELTFAEANILKALWRTAAARQGKVKEGNTDLYDAEKICFFALRMVRKATKEAILNGHRKSA